MAFLTKPGQEIVQSSAEQLFLTGLKRKPGKVYYNTHGWAH